MDSRQIGRAVTEINNWLDDEVPGEYKNNRLAQDWARISKIQEEAGEVIEVFIGLTGHNPRKGFHGSEEKFLGELADVAATAILAIQHFTDEWAETEAVLWDKLISLSERVPEKYRLGNDE